jgi:hypothetical protein
MTYSIYPLNRAMRIPETKLVLILIFMGFLSLSREQYLLLTGFLRKKGADGHFSAHQPYELVLSAVYYSPKRMA